MDGTLLNSNNEINSDFWKVYEELKKRNIFFSVASGRQYFDLLEKFQEIKEEIFFVAENGTYVMKGGEEIFSRPLGKENTKNLIDICRNIEGASPVLCGKKYLYLETGNRELINKIKKFCTKYKVVENLLEVDDDILKLSIYDIKGSEKNSFYYYRELKNEFKIVASSKNWLDIMDKTANKGVATEILQNILEITPEETMAFGDYLNDIEMLKNAKYSFAMENAHPKLKEIASFTAKSNNENGVLEAIKEVIFQRRECVKSN
jgi:Cof subfamily protein (haloacid dehalogenase superfamily)